MLQQVIVTKITDEKFKGNHPGKINEGYTVEGILINLKEGEGMIVDHPGKIFYTSVVEKIEEMEGYKLVHTMNSTYKVVPVFNAIPGVQEKYSLKLDEN